MTLVDPNYMILQYLLQGSFLAPGAQEITMSVRLCVCLCDICEFLAQSS